MLGLESAILRSILTDLVGVWLIVFLTSVLMPEFVVKYFIIMAVVGLVTVFCLGKR